MRLLLIEDDKEISEMLGNYLAAEGFSLVSAYDGQEGCGRFRENRFDCVLLDLMIPKKSGLDVMKYIRQTSTVPIIIITAKDTDTDKTIGLGLGADDYISKPYDIDILLAKISGIFKRRYADSSITCGNICLDKASHTVEKDGMPLALSAKEFDLLCLLMENRGRALSKEYIFNQIWGSDSYSEPQTLTVHIKWLRQKIEDNPSQPEKIITIWGMGYKFI